MNSGGGEQIELLAIALAQAVGQLFGVVAKEGEGLHRPGLEGVQELPLVAAVVLIDAGDGELLWPQLAAHLKGLAHLDPEAHRQRLTRQHLVGAGWPASGQQRIGRFKLGDKVHLRPLDGLPLPAGRVHRAARGGAYQWIGEQGLKGCVAQGALVARYPLGGGDIEIGGQTLAEPDLHAGAKTRHHDSDADGRRDGELQRHHRDGGAIEVIEGLGHPEPGGEGAARAPSQPAKQAAQGIGQPEPHGQQPAASDKEGATQTRLR